MTVSRVILGRELNKSMDWPEHLRDFVDSVEWVFAKTYARTWPHEYIVKDRVDSSIFEQIVAHIRTYGSPGAVYTRTITYYEQRGRVYWTMVPPEGDPEWYPIEQETIVNRCPKESTYEYRRSHGLLPERQSQ